MDFCWVSCKGRDEEKKVQGRKWDHVSGAGTDEKLLRQRLQNMLYFSQLISSVLEAALEQVCSPAMHSLSPGQTPHRCSDLHCSAPLHCTICRHTHQTSQNAKTRWENLCPEISTTELLGQNSRFQPEADMNEKGAFHEPISTKARRRLQQRRATLTASRSTWRWTPGPEGMHQAPQKVFPQTRPLLRMPRPFGPPAAVIWAITNKGFFIF